MNILNTSSTLPYIYFDYDYDSEWAFIIFFIIFLLLV
jgi:hypothetical protein